jgi:drug/metabolite transporter (DMT)-like permease
LEHFLGFIVLSPFIFIYWFKIKFLRTKDWLAIGWISLFGGLIGTIFITKAFFAAMDGDISFATVVILQKLQPIFALLFARLILKERLDKKFYGWALIAIIASYLIAFAKTGLNLYEIDWLHNAAFFSLIAAFSFGTSTVFGKRISNHLDYKAVAALRFGITAVLALLVLIFSASLSSINLVSSTQWSLLALIVLTSGAGSMFIYYFGLRRVSASAATILEIFWPFSALILDYVFNKNYLNITQSIALIILLFAFYKISALGKLKNKIFTGRVIHGQGRGKILGYPTANLDNLDLDIPHGVYAVRISFNGINYLGLMHFGFKDIFKEDVSLEILIKNFSGDIYGENLKIEVLKKIREIEKFSNPDLLIEAIKKDMEALNF